jgi:hypothetical protein
MTCGSASVSAAAEASRSRPPFPGLPRWVHRRLLAPDRGVATEAVAIGTMHAAKDL